MSTLRLNSIFCDVVADSAHSSLSDIFAVELIRISLASDDQVGVASHLAHPSEPTDDE